MRKKCQSCDGKGWLIDTTYDRTGEEVGCGACFGTGLSEEVIFRLLTAHRMTARRKHPRPSQKSRATQ